MRSNYAAIGPSGLLKTSRISNTIPGGRVPLRLADLEASSGEDPVRLGATRSRDPGELRGAPHEPVSSPAMTGRVSDVHRGPWRLRKKLRYEFRYDCLSKPVSPHPNPSKGAVAVALSYAQPGVGIRVMGVVAVGGLEPPTKGL